MPASLEAGALTDEDLDWLLQWSLENNEAGVHARYFFNWRVDSDSEECMCPDAAIWPGKPGDYKYLSPVFAVDVYSHDGIYESTVYVELD